MSSICVPFVQTSMSEVVTTTLDSDIESSLSSKLALFAPLTTAFTVPPDCDTKWFHISDSKDGGHNLLNYMPQDFETGIETDPAYFGDCVPYSSTSLPWYSPGVCPQGREVTGITLYELAHTSSMQVWEAICCPRYVKCSTF
jgi:hypothetical protein